MKFLKKLFIYAVLLTLLVAGLSAGAVYYGATRWRSPAPAEVVVRPGTSLRGIAAQLTKARVIGTPRLFELLARAKGLGRTLRAGTYEFPADSTVIEVLEKLASGDVKQYAFTVIEGWTIDEIAAELVGQPFLADAGVPERFEKLSRDRSFAASLGIEGAPSLEGYLFPDTYLVDKPLDERGIAKRLTDQFASVWSSIDHVAKARSALTKNEVVTLASIVEKETGVESERPLVAAVFLNRLAKGMPLQSDPTIIYGLPNFDGNIRKRDITNPHRYNTYVHPGLPPGPIANPGKASIEAVLRPARVDYLYFVAKGDGSHYFSNNLSDHLAAVRRYQLNGK